MLPRIGLTEIGFAQPVWLWLLVLPALTLAAWVWRFARRRADARRLGRRRLLPIRERLAFAGDLPFWLCVLAATACVILALARPHGPATAVRRAGVDLVVLQDASASMRVKDVSGDRWQRSMRFLRALADSLSWRTDRVAMALFAHIAAPQVRLTTDPNTFLFFLDNLHDEPPFRLEEDTTWDTNMELGLHWGLRLIDRDEEARGKSPNAKVFVLLSDGEVWSGEVERAMTRVNERGMPIFVIGVGTLGGGRMPVLIDANGKEQRDPSTPLMSRLDRVSLQQVAEASGGQYFELDRESDRQIANAIVDAAKRRAPTLGMAEEAEELYWRCLVLAAAFLAVGLLFVRERTELWIQAAGVGAVLVGLFTVLS